MLTVTDGKCWPAPYDYWHDRYQAYYREGLRALVGQSGGRWTAANAAPWPAALRGLRRVRDSWRLGKVLGPGRRPIAAGLDRLAGALGAGRLPPSGLFHPLVGQYVLRTAGRDEFRVAIDAQDGGDVGSPDLVAWSDVYFKTNFWRGLAYPQKVVSLPNGNPTVLGHLHRLWSLRSAPKEFDLCFVVRVWGGRDECEGVEHNLRLLEAVAQTPGRKFLLAYLVAGDIAEQARRLDRQGIPWTRDPVPLFELWQVAARSRLNVLRLGMHSCVPWRMVDLLAMGACPVLDQPPRTTWPEPLEHGRHYFTLDVVPVPGQDVANDGAYAAVPDRLGPLLADGATQQKVRGNSADYFDHHLTPEAVGRHIVRRLPESERSAATAVA